MNKIITLSMVGILVTVLFVSCSSTVSISTTTDRTNSSSSAYSSSSSSISISPIVTLPTTVQTPPVTFAFPDNGIIKLDGNGYFYFQRVFSSIEEPTDYRGVAFSRHTPGPGTTISAPVPYWFDMQFPDGTIEQIQYIGLGNENILDISLSKHDGPRAGVMLAWHNVEGGLQPVLYLLVSEEN